jgi:hypothetical protein
MKQRSPIAVFLLPIVTFGIYSWYWLVKTKGEMNSRGEQIPTAWIWLIPFVGTIWWLWKYAEGVEHVSGEKLSGVLAFILVFLLGNIGEAIIQDTFNKVGEVAAPAAGYAPAPEAQPVVDQMVDEAPVVPVAEPQMAPEAPAEPVDTMAAPSEEPAAPADQSTDQSQF